jgi:hypothetical protein
VHGEGALVRGPADAVLLGISGRPWAFDRLTGDGAPTLRERVLRPERPGTARRLLAPLRVLTSPPPPDRRSRQAAPPD